MADQNNPGQFGNRKDTDKMASKGGQASTGSFGDKNSANPSTTGKMGAEAQSRADKVRGGENSHRNE